MLLAGIGVSDMLPLQVTPPQEKDPKKVLKRPPILGDYINVTSSDGTRVFMVVKEDHFWMEMEVPGGWGGFRTCCVVSVFASTPVWCPVLLNKAETQIWSYIPSTDF